MKLQCTKKPWPGLTIQCTGMFEFCPLKLLYSYNYCQRDDCKCLIYQSRLSGPHQTRRSLDFTETLLTGNMEGFYGSNLGSDGNLMYICWLPNQALPTGTQQLISLRKLIRLVSLHSKLNELISLQSSPAKWRWKI